MKKMVLREQENFFNLKDSTGVLFMEIQDTFKNSYSI